MCLVNKSVKKFKEFVLMKFIREVYQFTFSLALKVEIWYVKIIMFNNKKTVKTVIFEQVFNEKHIQLINAEWTD